jgi:hypothetical protein
VTWNIFVFFVQLSLFFWSDGAHQSIDWVWREIDGVTGECHHSEIFLQGFRLLDVSTIKGKMGRLHLRGA